jgi:hypothetical protein
MTTNQKFSSFERFRTLFVQFWELRVFWQKVAFSRPPLTTSVSSISPSYVVLVMSELQAKLARRRSQIASPEEASKLKEAVEVPAVPVPYRAVLSTPETTPASTVNKDSGEKKSEGYISSPDAAPWRDTPSQKVGGGGIIASSPVITPAVDLSTDFDTSTAGFDNIDDFLGADIMKGLGDLEAQSQSQYSKGDETGKQTSSAAEAGIITGGGVEIGGGDEEEEVGRLRSQVGQLQAANTEKDGLISSLRADIARLTARLREVEEDDDDEDGDGFSLHPLRESESDPFNISGKDRRRSSNSKRVGMMMMKRDSSSSSNNNNNNNGGSHVRAARRDTRQFINSWAVDNSERRRSSSLPMGGTIGEKQEGGVGGGGAVFGSPDRMRDMFSLLLEGPEDSLIGSTIAGLAEDDVDGFDLRSSGAINEDILFGSGTRNKADYDKYDPASLSLGSVGLHSRTKADANAASAAPSASTEDRLFAQQESTIFTNVDSPSPRGGGAGAGAGAVRTDGLVKDGDASSQQTQTQQQRQQQTEQQRRLNEMTYMEFMDRLSEPESEDLARVIKGFLLSVLGPRGDGTAPSVFQDKEIDYTFYGVDQLERRMLGFYQAMDRHFRSHAAWQGFSDDKYVSTLDCLEKHCLLMIHDLAYDCVLQDTKEDDAALVRQMALLQFLAPDALDIPANLQNEAVWALAGNDLRRINSCRTPGEKIACVVACATLITRTVAAAKLSAGENADAGADEFLPLFIWVVLKAQVPDLMRNTEYISSFHQPTRLMGMGGYCLMNLRSALEFILHLDSAENISIDAATFDSAYALAQSKALVDSNGGSAQ